MTISCLPLVISCNWLVNHIAIKCRICTEYVIGKLERASIETAGSPSSFLAGFWRDDPGIPKLHISSAYAQNLDRAYNSRHIKTSFSQF
jgi:hypothetical protein